MSYEELSNKVEEAGLKKRTYVHYLVYFILVTLGCVTSIYFLTVTDNLYLQILNGVFLAVVLVQAGMLGHDFSHQQVFDSKKLNRVGGAIMWGLYGGVSEGGWYDKHNAHHKYVNHEGLDPDLGVPFIFSDVQVAGKSEFVKKFITPHQHWLFFFMLPFVYPNFVLWSFKRLFTSLTARNIVELILIFIHFALFFFFPLYFLPLGVAVIFLATVLLFAGFYMGLVFAPNHKGEEVVDEDTPATWVQQITLTRNLNPSLFSFYFFGGLDLQVEHHLFPEVSRFNYPKIHKIVKAYCAEHDIRFYETSWFNSVKEIYVSLKTHAK